jgi:hypothetical protein
LRVGGESLASTISGLMGRGLYSAHPDKYKKMKMIIQQVFGLKIIARILVVRALGYEIFYNLLISEFNNSLFF